MELFIGWLLGMASLSALLWYTSVRASNLHTGQDDDKYNFEPPTAPQPTQAPKRWPSKTYMPTVVVDTLDEVPKDCICDWIAEHTFAKAEPEYYVLGRTEDNCPIHGDPEAYYWTHRRDL